MDYIDLIKNIDKRQLNNIILLHAREPYLTELALESFQKDLLDQSFLDLNFNKYDFERLDKSTYLAAVETLPFMDRQKLVVVDNLVLERDRLKKHEESFKFIQDTFEDFNKQTLLVLIFRGDNIFKTGKFYKALSKYAQIYELGRLDRNQFYTYIIKHFARGNIRIDKSRAGFIADRLGYLARDSKQNLYDVNNELDKLVNNIKSKEPTMAEIEEAVLEHFQDNIFQLTDALSQRNIRTALDIYQRMVEDDEFMLFHMVLRQIKNLICVKDCNDKRMNKSSGMKYCMVGQFEYDKATTFSKNFRMDELLKLHELCSEAERKSKTDGSNMKDLLKRIIIAFDRGLYGQGA